MPNKNKNRFFPILENDGEPSTQPGSSSRSNTHAPQRAREETPSRPRAPTAQLAIEALPATSDLSASILTTLNSVLDRVNNLHDQFRNEHDPITAVFKAEVLATVEAINTKVCAVLDDALSRIDELESTPAPAPAPTPCTHEETIAALQNARMRVSAQMGTNIPANLKNVVLDCERNRHICCHPTPGKLRLYAREFDMIESTTLGSPASPAQPGQAHWLALTQNL
jgi:hypothetical protein